MSFEAALFSQALLESLRQAPLLVEDLPEACSWANPLGVEANGTVLNFEQKLGHLYEDALELLIRGCGGLQLLAKNLQIADASGRTLGEMDFLIRNLESGEVFQLELAVKFYLAFLDTAGVERYPGPDPRDNWINKLNRMRERQLRLSETAEARKMLAERFGVEEVVVRQRIYGMIFDPIAAEQLSAPPCIAAGCRRGKWLYVKEFDERYGSLRSARIVPKCLWPVPLKEALLDCLPTVSVSELRAQAAQRCVLFWDEAVGEVVFLVPDEWPNF